MSNTITFFNNENDGKYEYIVSNNEDYELLKKEIIEDLSGFFLPEDVLKDEVNFCKFNDGKFVNTTHRLIRLNDSINFNHKDFDLGEYIKKYSNTSIEEKIIKVENSKKTKYENGENMLIKGMDLVILGYLITKIISILTSK